MAIQLSDSSTAALLECAERARLIGEFQAEGIQVALPIDASSVSMLASLNPTVGPPSHWIAIQVVMAQSAVELLARNSRAAASVELTVAVIPRMKSPNAVHTYALTQAESIVVQTVDGDDRTQAIAPYAIEPGQWRQKLEAAIAAC